MRRFKFLLAISTFALLVSWLALVPSDLQAQIGAGQTTAERGRYGETITQKWQVGALIRTGSQDASSIEIAIPVPTDWDEQSVSLVEDDISSSIRNVKYQMLDDGVRRMTATIPRIRANSGVKVLITFEVQTKAILKPERTDNLVIPYKPDRDIKRHLNSSRLINHRKTEFKKLTKELVEGKETDWEKVEAIFNWVKDNITPIDTEEVRGAQITFKRQEGNGEDMVNLFVALCRSYKVPARIVWVDGLQYAEFYLEDENGEGTWFPCQPDGFPEFGQMTSPRVIQQKGDNIKVPGYKDRLRYVPEVITGSSSGPGPDVIWVRRIITD